jgi:hypothetical protein
VEQTSNERTLLMNLSNIKNATYVAPVKANAPHVVKCADMTGKLDLEDVLNKSNPFTNLGIRSVIIECRNGFKDLDSLRTLFERNELQIKQLSFYESGNVQNKKLQDENMELKRRLEELERKMSQLSTTSSDSTDESTPF